MCCSDAVGHDAEGITGVGHVHASTRRPTETWRKHFSDFISISLYSSAASSGLPELARKHRREILCARLLTSGDLDVTFIFDLLT